MEKDQEIIPAGFLSGRFSIAHTKKQKKIAYSQNATTNTRDAPLGHIGPLTRPSVSP
jgi:hypothetical protein